jgi:hypothetical protein
LHTWNWALSCLTIVCEFTFHFHHSSSSQLVIAGPRWLERWLKFEGFFFFHSSSSKLGTQPWLLQRYLLIQIPMSSFFWFQTSNWAKVAPALIEITIFFSESYGSKLGTGPNPTSMLLVNSHSIFIILLVSNQLLGQGGSSFFSKFSKFLLSFFWFKTSNWALSCFNVVWKFTFQSPHSSSSQLVPGPR